jgi:hypothetical protein
MVKTALHWVTDHPDVKFIVIVVMMIYAILAYQYVPYHIGCIYAPLAVYVCGSQYWNPRKHTYKEALIIFGVLFFDVGFWLTISK